MVAKKGEKLSQYTKDLMSKNRTKDKKKCQFCENQFVDLEKHHQKCPKNPKNRERLRVERNQKRKKNKDRINFLQNIATAKRMQIPEKREQRQKQQYKNSQKPEVKIQNNKKRKVRRPIKDKERSNCLFFILGGYKCVKCGFHDHRASERDHINDDGYLDNQRFSDDRSRDLYYVYHPEEARKKLQVLCANCNSIKEKNRREIEWSSKNHSVRSIIDRNNYYELKNKVFEILGGSICVICNFKDERALDLEHIDGEGNKDRKQYSRMNQFLKWVIENPVEAVKKLQITCRNCNTIKQHISDKGKCNCEKFHVNYF
jgi:hypothetical protein